MKANKKNKIKVTSRAGRKERKDRLSLSDTGIPWSKSDQLSADTGSICFKRI